MITNALDDKPLPVYGEYQTYYAKNYKNRSHELSGIA